MTAEPAHHEPDDTALVERARTGDRDAFEQLVRRHNQRLFRAARAVVHADSEAEDALQQAWLAIYRALPGFRGDAAFATWATRITVHAAIRVVRKRPEIIEVTDETSAGPDVELERAEVGRLLETCLAQLPQGNREVMVLRDVLELDTAETAACLGISEEAVRVRLHRARGAVATAFTASYDAVYRFDGARCDRITAAVMASL